MYKVPILLLLFNRIETAQKVFSKVRLVKPERLFIAVDGPREGVADDVYNCQSVRDIVNQIDWPCEVKTLFQEKNKGLLYGPAEAITWFFSYVEEGVILEDDCVPSDSFFKFCEILLEKYRFDERVMHIGGSNFNQGRRFGDSSYYFSKFNLLWGWASWRRAWKYYDTEMKNFPEFKRTHMIDGVWFDKKRGRSFNKIFEKIYNKKVMVWDYIWTYTVWSQNGLSALPNVNLISNIGSGPFATNTKDESDLMFQDVSEISEYSHPSFVLSNNLVDEFIYNRIFKTNIFKIVKNRLYKLLKR
ncbi:MAG: hypothetical protein AUJ23_01180 [Candidatus Magasanikbacteria bacterium CG1_02_32_51]|nr:MAG: hypothetical protein AUJ23_01180 [Candidatus Magasanikbacteria bacterium CG1_02_32_51]